jgi:hypothetical protein
VVAPPLNPRKAPTGAPPTEADVGRLALDFADADRAVREFAGVRGGEAWEALLNTWRDAYSRMLAQASAYRRNETHG